MKATLIGLVSAASDSWPKPQLISSRYSVAKRGYVGLTSAEWANSIPLCRPCQGPGRPVPSYMLSASQTIAFQFDFDTPDCSNGAACITRSVFRFSSVQIEAQAYVSDVFCFQTMHPSRNDKPHLMQYTWIDKLQTYLSGLSSVTAKLILSAFWIAREITALLQSANPAARVGHYTRRALKTNLFGHWQLRRRVTVFLVRCVQIRLPTYLLTYFPSF